MRSAPWRFCRTCRASRLPRPAAAKNSNCARRKPTGLGVAHRVNFLGRIPREEVEALYEQSDVFLFPSFREPSGSVVFEAMRHALPVIAADRGGPGHVVDATCGIKAGVENPDQFAAALAGAIRQCAADPQRVARLSSGARARAIELGSWPGKMAWMMNLYETVLSENTKNGAAVK